MDTKERVQLLKEQLVKIGVHDEAELQQRLEETKLDIAIFTVKPESDKRSA